MKTTAYENKPISTKDCFDMATKIGDKIEAAWRNFYLIVLAISAWCFSPSSTIILDNKLIFIIILVAISIFFTYNCIFIIKMYDLIAIFLDELVLRAKDGAFLREDNRDKFLGLAVNKMHKKSWWIAIIGHTVCFVAILVFITKPKYFG